MRTKRLDDIRSTKAEPDVLEQPNGLWQWRETLRTELRVDSLAAGNDGGRLLPGLVVGDTSPQDDRMVGDMQSSPSHVSAVSAAITIVSLGAGLLAGACRAGPTAREHRRAHLPRLRLHRRIRTQRHRAAGIVAAIVFLRRRISRSRSCARRRACFSRSCQCWPPRWGSSVVVSTAAIMFVVDPSAPSRRAPAAGATVLVTRSSCLCPNSRVLRCLWRSIRGSACGGGGQRLGRTCRHAGDGGRLPQPRGHRHRDDRTARSHSPRPCCPGRVVSGGGSSSSRESAPHCPGRPSTGRCRGRNAAGTQASLTGRGGTWMLVRRRLWGLPVLVLCCLLTAAVIVTVRAKPPAADWLVLVCDVGQGRAQ